jgi:outer membrane protein OmpA-like peptidoglycan-associated protein
MALPPLQTSGIKEEENQELITQGTINNSPQKKQKQFDLHKSDINKRKYLLSTSVYFQSNKSDLSKKDIAKIKEIAELLLNNPDLGVEINGYTDAKGSEKHNKILSDLRARAVLQILVENEIMPQRTILKGYGETKSIKHNNPEDRRADINIFRIEDINNLSIIQNNNTEINDIFPIDKELLNENNIEYKIQVAACMHPRKKSFLYKGLKVSWYKYGKCKNYVYGSYKTKTEAIDGLVYVIKKGFKGAFIVKFVDGQRVD